MINLTPPPPGAGFIFVCFHGQGTLQPLTAPFGEALALLHAWCRQLRGAADTVKYLSDENQLGLTVLQTLHKEEKSSVLSCKEFFFFFFLLLLLALGERSSTVFISKARPLNLIKLSCFFKKTSWSCTAGCRQEGTEPLTTELSRCLI